MVKQCLIQWFNKHLYCINWTLFGLDRIRKCWQHDINCTLKYLLLRRSLGFSRWRFMLHCGILSIHTDKRAAMLWLYFKRQEGISNVIGWYRLGQVKQMSMMVKEKPNSIRTYDEDGFRRRAACLCFKDEAQQEVNSLLLFVYLF